MTKPKAIVYCRYSSDLQHETSIERQLELARIYAERHNIEIVKEFIDKAVSSKVTGNLRKELGKALEFLKEHPEVTHFISEDMDRVSRENPITFIGKVSDFLMSGITIVESANGNTLNPKTTSDDVLRIFISQWLGSKENEKKAKRIKESYERRVLEGRACPKPLYGYKRFNGEMVIDTERSAIVQRIYQMYADGNSCNAIARILNREGVETPGRANKNKPNFGRCWSSMAVKRIIEHETYHTGHQKSNNGLIEGAYPTFIDKPLFESVRKRTSVVRQYAKRPDALMRLGKYGNLFTDLIFCKRCGVAFHVLDHHKTQFRRYRCSQNVYHACDNDFVVHINHFEEVILAALVEYVDIGEFGQMVKDINSRTKELKNGLEKELKAARGSLKQEEGVFSKQSRRLGMVSDKVAEVLAKEMDAQVDIVNELTVKVQSLQLQLDGLSERQSMTLMELRADIEDLKILVTSAGHFPGVRPVSAMNVSPQEYHTQGVNLLKEAVVQSRVKLKAVIRALVEKIAIDSKGNAEITLKTGQLQSVGLLQQYVS